MKPKAILLLSNAGWAARTLTGVYNPRQRARLEPLVDLHPDCIYGEDLSQPEVLAVTRTAEIVMSGWGMPVLTAEQIEAVFPKVRALFYAAGTVQAFARPFLARGVTIVSSWAANAIPVSEFAMAQILLATKRTLPLTRRLRNGSPERWRREVGPGNYETTVALISLGMIGRRVAELLKPFDLNVVAYEPFAKPGMEADLKLRLVSLEECFRESEVVSLHAPNLPVTQKMIQRRHFESMREGATFINTARGGPVDQEAMLEVLAARPDLTAIIDVTDPVEPPAANSPYYTLENVFLTPHIAGATGNEVGRLAEYAIDELESYLAGRPLRYAVDEAMLATMA